MEEIPPTVPRRDQREISPRARDQLKRRRIYINVSNFGGDVDMVTTPPFTADDCCHFNLSLASTLDGTDDLVRLLSHYITKYN